MHIHCELVMLTLALTLHGQVHTLKIIGGHEAVPHSRSYMVLLEKHMQNGKKGYCSGFLLNEEFVMTAAHCQARSCTVLLGVHAVSDKDIQRIPVCKTFPHEDFIADDLKNDIMLLKLRSKANFGKNVKPIELAGRGDGALPKSCIVSGWGRANSSHMSDILMEVNVELVANEQCEEENLYCSEGRAGPGEGDSGGPLVCEDGKAYGVVSFSVDPNLDGFKTYTYVNIPVYRNWIDSTMKDAWKTP